MTVRPVEQYEPERCRSIDLFSAALQGEPCTVLGLGREPVTMPSARWVDGTGESDEVVLASCQGPTVDVGCGPGRMTFALAAQGICALGIDVVPEAVAQTRARGASAILRNVFSRVPGEGRWHTALLADGNIGIGGDPARLLRRVSELVSGHGRIVVDLSEPGVGLSTRELRLQVGGRCSEPFAWSLLSPEVLPEVAAEAGLRIGEVREHRARWFAVLHKGGRS